MKTRIISAAIALAIVVPLLIIGGKAFALGVGILSVLAYKEIVDLKESHKKLPILVQIIGLINLLLLVFSEFDGYSIMFGVTYKGIALTLISLLIPAVLYRDDKYTMKDAFFMIGAIILLGAVFNVFILLRALSLYQVLYLMLIAIMTDTFAMVIGGLIGKHKLIPDVSPKKTWEGSVAGSIVGSAIAIIFYSYLIGEFSVSLVVITLLLSIVGQFGDLVFSKIKRENKIKDFSNIMPGHGGILDRLDSLIFISLAYIILISFL